MQSCDASQWCVAAACKASATPVGTRRSACQRVPYAEQCVIGRTTVTRWCRGATYVISVKNAGKGGQPKLVVDGKAVSGNLVPYAKAGATVQVECTV